MPYTITWDPDQQLACLVDPDTPRALGPVMLGPDAVTTLTAFVGAMDRDPTLLLPWEIDAQFAEFVVAVQAMQDAEQTAALTPPAEPGASPEPEAVPGADYPIIEPLAPPAAPADTDQPQVEPDPEPVVTFDPFPPGAERCPNCQATTFEGEGAERTCAICGVKVPERYVG